MIVALVPSNLAVQILLYVSSVQNMLFLLHEYENDEES